MKSDLHYFSFATGDSNQARIQMGGSAYQNKAEGKITGTWTGSWSGTSDRRLKENIVPIENAVDTLMKINVYGFIAQEICENTPELAKMCVETNNWGEEEPAYIIDDRPILACAIKTIQTQQKEIDLLKSQIDLLKSQMAEILSKINT